MIKRLIYKYIIYIIIIIANTISNNNNITIIINIWILLLLIYITIFPYENNNIIGDLIEWIFVISILFILLFLDNLITMFISIELFNLSIYIYIYKKSSYKNNINILYYYFINTIISLILLIGILYNYEDCLDQSLTNIKRIIDEDKSMGIKIIIISIFMKLGIGPFYVWKINLYNQVNNIKLLFISSVPIYLNIYLLYYIMNIMWDNIKGNFIINLLYLISFSLIISAINIRENIYNLILIYSSIYNTSLLFYNLILTLTSGGGYNLYLFPILYFLNLVGLFHLINQTQKTNINKKQIKLIMLILIFSLISFPPFSGFFSKFYLLYHSFALAWNWITTLILAIIILITTIIIASLYLKFIKLNYFNPPVINSITLPIYKDMSYAIISFSIISIFSPILLFVFFPF